MVRDVTDSDAEEQPTPELPAKKLGSRKIVIVAAAAVLVLGGIGTGIYFLTRGDDAEPASTASSSGAGPTSNPPTSGPTSTSTPAQPEPGAASPAEVGSAKAVAVQAIQAINVRDPETMKKISCDPAGIDSIDTAPPDAKAELVSDPELAGDTGTVQLKLTIGDQATTIPLPLRKQNGTWCVD